jgi:hypothetical protein
MPLSLKDGVYYVRTEIGELDQFNWSDNQIISDLNDSAKEMASVASILTGFSELTLTSNGVGGYQEVALNVEVDAVKACKYFSGQLFDLEPGDWDALQSGASTGSIPRWYYLKTATQEMTPQSTETSDIVVVPIPAPAGAAGAYYTVLGVWPIPPADSTVHVWYSYFHKYMQSPTDICALPPRFLTAWAAKAIARCLRIEKDYDGADRFMAIHNAGVEELRIYAGKQKQQDRPARYGTIQEPWRQNASSSVILVDPYPSGP